MSDQAKAVVDESVSAKQAEESTQAKDDFKLGIKPIDDAVHKIDSGIRKISQSAHMIIDSKTKR